MTKQTNSGWMLAALSAANDVILRTTSHKELHQKVCDVIVEGGEFVAASIFVAESDGRLRYAAGAGARNGCSTGATLRRILRGARFLRCRFIRCRFSRAELPDTAFEDCAFLMQSEGCTFTFCNLRAARFLRCDLSLCRIERSDLFDIAMDQCVLRGVRLHKADFSHAYSRKLVTTRASFRGCNLELADLSEARLPGCDFSGSRLREADLSAADLTGAILRDCDLFQAVLVRTRLADADLRGADISGLNLLQLAGFAGLKINQSQQHILLDGIGIDVHPEPG